MAFLGLPASAMGNMAPGENMNSERRASSVVFKPDAVDCADSNRVAVVRQKVENTLES